MNPAAPRGIERWALRAYGLATWMAQPLLRVRLARRARAEPLYGQCIDERFGRYAQPPPPPGALWLHAVSLGETRAAAVLLAELRRQRPGLRVLLTHGTATGRAEGARLLQPGDRQAWLPWDTAGAVARFLAHFRPAAGLLLETEVWPNLVAGCRAAGVPLLLANARLNERSLAGARRWRWLARPAYAGLSAAWAQTAEDRDRLRQLGAPVEAMPMGNLKFDATPDPQPLALGHRWRQRLGRAVLLLASSREGEEAALIEVLQQKSMQGGSGSGRNASENEAKVQEPVWLVVPRHPQRFDAVAAALSAAGWHVSRRSQWGDDGPPPPDARTIWLGDSMGEMALYYGLADLALMGGSFAPFGGQNLIEAAACGCPVLLGPHTFNFAEAADLAIAAGCAQRADGLQAAVTLAGRLLADADGLAAMRAQALAFTGRHRGTAGRLAQAVLAWLPQAAMR